MKTTKKLLSILLAMVMLFTLALPAFAAETTYTITIENPQAGSRYKIYKVFDATYVDGTGITYQLPSGATLGENDYFELDTAGNVVLKKDDDGKYVATGSTDATGALVQGAVEWLQKTYMTGEATKTSAEVTANQATVVFNELAAGYYIVVRDETPTGKVSITSTNPTATIIDKNGSTPVPSGDHLKTITGGKGVTALNQSGTAATAQLGETVDFKVEFNAVNYVKDANGDAKAVLNYGIKDTATGLKIDWDNVQVTVGTTPLTKDATTNGFTVDSNEGTVTIPWSNATDTTVTFQDYAVNNVKVTITYSAIVTAVETSNKAEIVYDGTPIKNNDTVTTKSGEVIVNKVDGNSAALAGATFILKKVEGEGANQVTSYYKYTEATANTAAKVEWISDKDKATPYTTEVSGTGAEAVAKIRFVGLNAGTYYAEEIAAPNGYNGVTSDITFTITGEDVTDADVTTYVVHNDEQNVVNNRGTVLPSTGGIGTTIFYVVGGLLVLGAAVVLISKKRMGNQQ